MAFNHQSFQLNKNWQGIGTLPSIPAQLFTAATTALGTAFAIGMTRRTGFTTVVLPFFVDRIAQGNDAKTGFTGTFHGCNSSHNLNSGGDGS
jgi:hypothetical protein